MKCIRCNRKELGTYFFCTDCGQPLYPVYFLGDCLYKQDNIYYGFVENSHTLIINNVVFEGSTQRVEKNIGRATQGLSSEQFDFEPLSCEFIIKKDKSSYKVRQKIQIFEFPELLFNVSVSPLEESLKDDIQICGNGITLRNFEITVGKCRGYNVNVAVKLKNKSFLKINKYKWSFEAGNKDGKELLEGQEFSLSTTVPQQDSFNLELFTHIGKITVPFEITARLENIPDITTRVYKYKKDGIFQEEVSSRIDFSAPAGYARIYEVDPLLIKRHGSDVPLVVVKQDNEVIYEGITEITDRERSLPINPKLLNGDKHTFVVEMQTHSGNLLHDNKIEIIVNRNDPIEARWLAIDFGTENTTVAVESRDSQGEPKPTPLLLEKEGAINKKLIPSVIAVDGKDIDNKSFLINVGSAIQYTAKAERWHKLKLHKGIMDRETEKVRKETCIFLYEVLRRAFYHLWDNGRMINSINNLLVSCPTRYITLKRYKDTMVEIIKEAGKMFVPEIEMNRNNIRFVDEAIAQLPIYNPRKGEKKKHYLICDFGGGTTDIAFVALGEDKTRIVAYGGSRFGGAHVSTMFLSQILKTIESSLDIDYGFKKDGDRELFPSSFSVKGKNIRPYDDFLKDIEHLKVIHGLKVENKMTFIDQMKAITKKIANESIEVIPHALVDPIKDDIENEVEILLNGIKEQLSISKEQNSEKFTILLTGGSSQLKGFKDIVEKVSEQIFSTENFDVKQLSEFKLGLVKGMGNLWNQAPDFEYTNHWEVFVKQGLRKTKIELSKEYEFHGPIDVYLGLYGFDWEEFYDSFGDNGVTSKLTTNYNHRDGNLIIDAKNQ